MLLNATTTRALLLTFMLLLTGCHTPHAGQANYVGPPEAVVLGATKKQLVDLLVAKKLEKGMQVRDVSEYGFTVVKRLEGNLTAALLFGSRYDSTPAARVIYGLVDVPGGVKVFVRAEIVTNPGSGFERVNDVTASAGSDIRRELEELQASFAPTGR